MAYMEREITDWHELYRVGKSRVLDKDTRACPPVPAVPGKDGFMTFQDKTTADKTDKIMQYISYRGKYVMYTIV